MILAALTIAVSANALNMASGCVTQCAGFLYDDGGPNGNLSFNRTYTLTIYPENPDQAIAMYFNSVKLGYDGNATLYIYDGSAVNPNKLIQTFTGNTSNKLVVANSGPMTLRFVSTNLILGAYYEGWEAEWWCIPQVYPMANQTVTTCNGRITTSGGLTDTYSANEDYTLTVNADGTNKGLALVKLTATFSDSLWIYDGSIASGNLLAKGAYFNIPGYLRAETGTATFRFKSLNGPLGGFAIGANCFDKTGVSITDGTTSAPEGTLYDTGGLNGDYGNQESDTFTITGTNSTDRIILTFYEFDLESCCDSLYVYDGSFGNLIWKGSGTYQPFFINSTTNSLIVRFVSDHSAVHPGWLATWKIIPESLPLELVGCHWAPPVTDIHDFEHTGGFKIYPNPVSNRLLIEFEGEEGIFSLYDALGRQVYFLELSNKSTAIDLSHLHSGVYFYSIEINGKGHKGKLLVE